MAVRRPPGAATSHSWLAYPRRLGCARLGARLLLSGGGSS